MKRSKSRSRNRRRSRSNKKSKTGSTRRMLGIPKHHWAKAKRAMSSGSCDTHKISKKTFNLVGDALSIKKSMPVFKDYVRKRKSIQKSFATVYKHCSKQM